jgi:hypothetical protein
MLSMLLWPMREFVVKLRCTFAWRRRNGFAVVAARPLKSRWSASGVAAPGLDVLSMSPPSFSTAATSSADEGVRAGETKCMWCRTGGKACGTM